MELHPLDTAAVRILFCGRPALTTGVVNLRLLLGGDGGEYCLAEKRKAKLSQSRRDGARGGGANGNNFAVSGHAKEKRESVYRVCSSDGLPGGCYHVKADRHYWVMRAKGESGAAATPPQSSASMSATQATPLMPLAAALSTVEPSRTANNRLVRRTRNRGGAAAAPAAAGAMLATADSSPALTSAGDVACTGVTSRQQKAMSRKRRCIQCADTVEGGIGSLPLIPNTLSTATSRATVSPPREGVPGDTVVLVSDVEGAPGGQYLGTPPSARTSAPAVIDALGRGEETPSSQRQWKQPLERRKKASCMHVDTIAGEGGGSDADAAGTRAGTKTSRGSNGAHGEVSSSAPLAEHRAELGAGSSQPLKKPQPRGKRRRSSDLTAEEPPSPLPLPTLETLKTAQSRTELRPGELETLAPASTAKLTDAAPSLLPGVTESESESAPTPAPRARKSRKSSAANSVVSAAATSDAADTATLSKAPAPPLSPLPLCSAPSGRPATSEHNKTPSDAYTHTASLAPPPPQKQRQPANSPAMQSPVSVPQDATPNVLYSNRSSTGYTEARRSTAGNTTAPAVHDKLRQRQQQRHDSRSALESPSNRSQVDPNRSASTSSLLGPLPSPLLQRQSQWGGISGGGFYPSDSPALGFTQVHNTLTEEFSLDITESESESAASEYLYDVVE
ncbi:hypothetical protein GH5_06010 [Leishmania sp. Ghana 2012 LV757]|uniref:hypothetical protein n=1 Tax=Leishmania sp. Ghana 2012 LV757 TaxID=2803181 RepID=UPI001B4D415E|nr:hypothetical protein GH5_06010 [Leishmania sp. Ghana 2012 LV757]